MTPQALDRGDCRLAAVLVLLCLAYAALLLPAAPVIEPDSDSYLRFAPIRSAGYPLLLQVLGIAGTVRLQPLLYAAALGFLAWESGRTAGLPAGLAVAVLGMASPDLNRYHAAVLTESVFLSLLALFLGLALRFLRRPGPGRAAAVSLAVGLAATVRPNAYALLPVLALLPLLPAAPPASVSAPAPALNRRRLLAAALLPALLLAGGERVATGLYFGDRATSLAGRHFYAKAAMIEAPPAPLAADPQRRRLDAALETDFAPIRRLLPQMPRWDAREALSEDYETCLEYACAVPLREASGLPEPAFNALALRAGLDRIGRAPLAFAALWLERYRSLWTLNQATFPPAAAVYNRFMAEHRPLPFAAADAGLVRAAEPKPLAWLMRAAILAVGVLTALLALGLPAALAIGWRGGWRGGDIRLLGAGLAALGLQGSQLLTALVGVGIPRYTLSLWPAMVLALVLVLAWIFGRPSRCMS